MGTVHPLPAAVQHMRIDHRRSGVVVPRQFLHRPDVATRSPGGELRMLAKHTVSTLLENHNTIVV